MLQALSQLVLDAATLAIFLAFALLAVLVFLVVPWWFWGLLMAAIVAVWPWQARWLREQAERDRARRG